MTETVHEPTLERLEQLPDFVLHSAIRTVRKHPFVGWAWSLLRLDFTGIAFGAFFVCWSLTPSLLPRGWLFQGIVSGINAAIGYGVGVAVQWAVKRWFLHKQPWWPLPDRFERALKIVVPVLSTLAVAIMLAVSAQWQRELSVLMSAEGTTTTGYFRTGAIMIVIAALLISLWRVLRDIRRFIVRKILRRTKIPRGLANAIGVALVVVVGITLIQGVLLRGFISAANSISSVKNDETRSGVEQPTEAERSGSPQSTVSWDSLGYEGRNFVAGGLTADQMTEVTGRPAEEPIRAYVGLASAPTSDERMSMVIDELERTGAFSRKAIVVMPTTGTGWVDPVSARAFEMMYDGDTAIIATQYSYLPSWISFIADREASAAAGRKLIDTVQQKWSSEPEETRPKLYVYGESLGSQAGEAAFTDISDIRDKVDGVLWVGPPNSNRIWQTYVTRRDPGTTEVEPEYAGGLLVRFADSAARLDAQTGPWPTPRVLYMQHASDPIVWWSPSLLFERPDWLAEPPGSDRLASMRWFPIVTFWQVTADMTNSLGVPSGHGHSYGASAVDSWAAVAAPEGWTTADTERVQADMDEVGEKFPNLDAPE
ncbi:alpha/beta hydrolase [Actinomycetes bacterium M1A6_2h]